MAQGRPRSLSTTRRTKGLREKASQVRGGPLALEEPPHRGGGEPPTQNRETVTGQRPTRASSPLPLSTPFFPRVTGKPRGTSENGAKHTTHGNHHRARPSVRRRAGERETTRPLRTGHLLRVNLERSRSTTRVASEAKRTHTRSGRACGAANQPKPSTGLGRKAETAHGESREGNGRHLGADTPTPDEQSSVCDGGREGSDRMTAPLPSTRHQKMGRRGEGPAGRTRRAAAIRHECPSLAWRGLGSGPKRAQQHHIDPLDVSRQPRHGIKRGSQHERARRARTGRSGTSDRASERKSLSGAFLYTIYRVANTHHKKRKKKRTGAHRPYLETCLWRLGSSAGRFN